MAAGSKKILGAYALYAITSTSMSCNAQIDGTISTSFSYNAQMVVDDNSSSFVVSSEFIKHGFGSTSDAVVKTPTGKSSAQSF